MAARSPAADATIALMRRILLWAARNRWLKERLPRFRWVRRATKRFMPGETASDALTAAVTHRAWGIDRHGGQRLHGADRRVLRARPSEAGERRALPPGLPPPHAGRRAAAAAAATRHPPGQGRLRRAGLDRLPAPAGGGWRLRRALHATPGGRARRAGAVRGRDPRRRAPRADGPLRDGHRPRSGPHGAPDALRHPARPAAPPLRGRLRRARAHRLRLGLVPLVHAPPRRAAGQRRLRPAPDAAVRPVQRSRIAGRSRPATRITGQRGSPVSRAGPSGVVTTVSSTLIPAADGFQAKAWARSTGPSPRSKPLAA